jgi:hypothetical protein
MSVRVLKRPAVARVTLFATVLMTSFAAMASTAPLSIVASGATLALIILLLWRGDDPPILLLPALFQWSEIAMWPLSTIWKQLPINDLSIYQVDLEYSALYGMLGLTTLVIGCSLGSRCSNVMPFSVRLRTDATYWRYRDVASFSVATIAAGYAFAIVSSLAGPARELFNQASNVKYLGIFVLAYWCLIRESHYGVLFALSVFEVVFGMTGFFAEFKNSILTLIVAALAARPRLRSGDVVVVGATVSLLLGVATFWSSIKDDYRLLLNKGTGAQIVDISMADRLTYLASSVASMNGARLAEGFDKLVMRHGYIEYLALTMQNVPQGVPHENGQLTLGVLAHITMPRILFPDKPPLPSDTEIMAKYTGLGLSLRWNENTSISIGYLGELYVDFGFFGAVMATGLIGWLVGRIYGMLRGDLRSPALISAGLCVMAVLPIAYFGTAYSKLIGSFVFSSAIAFALQRYALPIILAKSLARVAAVQQNQCQRGPSR